MEAMDVTVLSKFDLGMPDPTKMGDFLWEATKKYEAIVESVNGQREAIADAESRVRNTWADNPETLKIAETMIASVKSIFVEAMNQNPELSASLYKAITGTLADFVKSERDFYVNDALKTSRVMPDVPTDDIKDLQKLIGATFTMCQFLGQVPIDYPVEYSETTKTKRPKLSRKPYEARKASTTEALIKRFVWTINGKTVMDSPAGVRKSLGVDKVADIYDAFGIENRGKLSNGETYRASINGFNVTMKVTGPNDDEPTEVDLSELED
jgi:hypothetical protein